MKASPHKIIKSLSSFIPAFIVICVAIVFFAIYNNYLIDSYIDNLHSSLISIEEGYTSSENTLPSFLLDINVRQKLSEKDFDQTSVALLQLSKRVASINEGEGDVKAFLKEQVSTEEKTRGVLSYIDKTRYKIRDIGVSIRSFFFPSKTQDDSLPIGFPKNAYAILEEAHNAEKELTYYKAISNYLEYTALVKPFRNYSAAGYSEASFALSVLYYRIDEKEKASSILKKIISLNQKNTYTEAAKSLLSFINYLPLSEKEYTKKESELHTEKEPLKRQEIYFSLASIRLESMHYEEAAKLYEKSSKCAEESILADKARYNSAWAYQQLGQNEKAREIYMSVRNYKSSAYMAIGDIYRSEGEYNKALYAYERASSEAKRMRDDNTLRSVALYQSGYTSLYDLEDIAGAQYFFSRAAKISPFKISEEITRAIEKKLTTRATVLYNSTGKGDFMRELDSFILEKTGSN